MRGHRQPLYDTPVGMGKRVAVVGAGNTAMDSARVAMRMGAESVTVVYRRSRRESPARAEELEHAIEEGIHFQWLTLPVEILGDAGRLGHRHALPEDGTGRAGCLGPPPAGGGGGVGLPDRCGYRDLRAGHHGEPDHRADHSGPRHQQVGIHRHRRTHRDDQRSRACSPAAISSPARPPSSWPWARASAPRRECWNTWAY